MTKARNELGHNMALKVVAEGVDNEESFAMLQNWGCDIAQGYYISRPLPADKLVAWLSEARILTSAKKPTSLRAYA